MPTRALARRASAVGYATPTNCPIYINSTDNIPRIIPAGTGSTELPVVLSVSATGSGARLAAGSGALVSGTATITTGLTSILGFSIDNTSQPTGTGVASAQILQASWTTGAVTVTAFSISSVTGATIAASGSSGSFTWVAIGL